MRPRSRGPLSTRALPLLYHHSWDMPTTGLRVSTQQANPVDRVCEVQGILLWLQEMQDSERPGEKGSAH